MKGFCISWFFLCFFLGFFAAKIESIDDSLRIIARYYKAEGLK